MKVLGNRVYLDMPEVKESKLSISPELKRDLKEEEVKKFDKLKVFAVGDTVTSIKPGDEVFLDPLSTRAGIVTVSIEGKEKLITSIFHISHIW